MATNCPQRMVKVGREYTMEETSSWDVEGVDPCGSRSTPREKLTYPTFWKRKIIDSKVPWEGICLLLRKKGIQSLFQIKWRLFIGEKKNGPPEKPSLTVCPVVITNPKLVGGWTNPFGKICSSKREYFPRDGGKHIKIFELPPPSKLHALWHVRAFHQTYHMGLSKNRGTPKWMIYNGKPY